MKEVLQFPAELEVLSFPPPKAKYDRAFLGLGE